MHGVLLLKTAVSIARTGHRGVLIVSDDPTGFQYWGTKHLEDKLQFSLNFAYCNSESTWDKVAHEDTAGLSTGDIKIDITIGDSPTEIFKHVVTDSKIQALTMILMLKIASALNGSSVCASVSVNPR